MNRQACPYGCQHFSDDDSRCDECNTLDISIRTPEAWPTSRPLARLTDDEIEYAEYLADTADELRDYPER